MQMKYWQRFTRRLAKALGEEYVLDTANRRLWKIYRVEPFEAEEEVVSVNEKKEVVSVNEKKLAIKFSEYHIIIERKAEELFGEDSICPIFRQIDDQREYYFNLN